MWQNKITIRILVIFNIITVLLYLVPPVIRESTNRFLVVIYLSISIALIYVGFNKGYLMGNRKSRMYYTKWGLSEFTPRVKVFFLLFYVFTVPVKYAYLIGCSPLEIPKMIGIVATGIADPNFGYYYSLNKPVSPVPWSVYFLISIVDSIFFVVCYSQWKCFNRWGKILIIILSAIEIAYWAGMGTSFGIIFLVSIILFSFLMNYTPENKIKGVRVWLIAGVLCFVAVSFFTSNLINRSTGDEEKALQGLLATYQINDDNPLIRMLPDRLWAAYYYVYSYCCQGYEALGLSFNLPMTFTWLSGSNPAWMMLVKVFTGYDAMEDSYMAALDNAYGVDRYVTWHSAYLWWANDFTYLGALLVVYFLAMLAGLSLNLFVRRRDFLSSIVYIILSDMLLMLFANNTLLSQVFYSFMFVFPYWFFTRVCRLR